MASAVKVADAQAIIHQIVQLLQGPRRPFVANEVVKGGSLGHGTAVPGHFDVDLVMYSTDITEQGMLSSVTATAWAQNMDRFLRQNLHGYQWEQTKEHAVSFKVIFGGNKEIKIDLLLSPYYESKKTLLDSLSYYKQRCSPYQWPGILQTFSASASKWQVEFIEQFPNQMKELIKRAKKWRNDQWPDHLPNSGRPKSYLMAVLVISACCDYKEQLGYRTYSDMVERVNMDTLARNVAAIMREDVQNHHNFRISWIQQLEEYPSARVPQPYILDPANPFNNMYLSGVGPYQPGRHFCEYDAGNGRWGPFAEKVHSLNLDFELASCIRVADAQAIIHQIVQLLQGPRRLFVANEVVKGGSLGHGTAVPGHFDVDLVMYSTDITEQGMLSSVTATAWAQNMDRFLRQNLHGYQWEQTKEHAVSFKVIFGGNKEIKIDLLLSPYYESKKTLLDSLSYYKQRCSPYQWPGILQTFSASASKWQVEFIEQFPNQMKELIKRAKKWRNDQWPDYLPNSGRPKSYLMAVLVISACCDYKEQLGYRTYSDMVERVNMDTLARNVAAIMREDVQNHHNFRISWIQQLEEYPSARVPQPYILDPANPFNNMYLSGVGPYQPDRHFCEYDAGNGKWGPFAEKVWSLDLRGAVYSA